MTGIGVIGTGDIAPRYLAGIAAAKHLRLVGIGRRNEAASIDRAAALAARFGSAAMDVDGLLASPEIDVIVNLSAPLDHAGITRAALRAGKHVYSEKPLAASVDEAAALVALAADLGLVLSVAPATPLGPLQQQARGIVDSGVLGAVAGASATLVYPGPDKWHHNPAALFGAAAGPLFDMGVYDIAALTALLGPVAQVTAFGRRLHNERRVRQGPAAGRLFPVGVDTHVTALLGFVAGPLATLTLSFDGFGSAAPGLEIYGDKAAIRCGRSSSFTGDAALSQRFGEWHPIDRAPDGWNDGWDDALWIIGLLDHIAAIADGSEPRCAGRHALHDLAVLEGITTAIAERRIVDVGHSCAPPPPLPPGAYAALRQRFGIPS